MFHNAKPSDRTAEFCQSKYFFIFRANVRDLVPTLTFKDDV